jgi:hypothetical protein
MKSGTQSPWHRWMKDILSKPPKPRPSNWWWMLAAVPLWGITIGFWLVAMGILPSDMNPRLDPETSRLIILDMMTLFFSIALIFTLQVWVDAKRAFLVGSPLVVGGLIAFYILASQNS